MTSQESRFNDLYDRQTRTWHMKPLIISKTEKFLL